MVDVLAKDDELVECSQDVPQCFGCLIEPSDTDLDETEDLAEESDVRVDRVLVQENFRERAVEFDELLNA
jgi:hypothetical protein